MGSLIPMGKVGTVDGEFDLACFSSFDSHSFKGFELFLWMFNFRIRIVHITLDNLIAITTASIGNGERNGHGMFVFQINLWLTISERRVTQSVAERIEHIALLIHIGTAITDIIVHHGGQIENILHPCLSGATGRIDASEECIGYGMALLLTAMGDVEDGRQMVITPIDGIWETADKHKYCVLVGTMELTNEIFIGQLQR